MRVRRTASAICGLLLSAGVGLAAPAFAAPCDAYSQTCPSTPPGTIGGGGTGGASAPDSVPTPVAGGNDNAANGNPGNGNPGNGNPGGATTGPGGGASNEGRTLPFTGAELLLLTVVGGGAIAGGTMFVIAGRRRRLDAA